jgi:hypothetical protein
MTRLFEEPSPVIRQVAERMYTKDGRRIDVFVYQNPGAPLYIAFATETGSMCGIPVWWSPERIKQTIYETFGLDPLLRRSK